MAEYLFVGGPWDGQRREVDDICGEPPFGVTDGESIKYVRVSAGCHPFFVVEGMDWGAACAALLENYRPNQAMADPPLQQGVSYQQICAEQTAAYEKLGEGTVDPDATIDANCGLCGQPRETCPHFLKIAARVARMTEDNPLGSR